MAASSCDTACFRECNKDVPGNTAYCKSECDDYCAADGAKGKNDVVRSDLSEPRKGEGKASAPEGKVAEEARRGES